MADTGLILYIPSVVDGNPLIARVPGYESDTINVNGLSDNMYDLSPRDFDSGRYFTSEEDQRAAHVAIIGRNVADSLFPDGRAVDRTFMMDGAEYTVIGVYSKAKGGFFGENGQDNEIDIPLHTAESRYPQINRFMIVAQAKTGQAPGSLRRSRGHDAPTAPSADRTQPTISPSRRRTRLSSSSIRSRA